MSLYVSWVKPAIQTVAKMVTDPKGAVETADEYYKGKGTSLPEVVGAIATFGITGCGEKVTKEYYEGYPPGVAEKITGPISKDTAGSDVLLCTPIGFTYYNVLGCKTGKKEDVQDVKFRCGSNPELVQGTLEQDQEGNLISKVTCTFDEPSSQPIVTAVITDKDGSKCEYASWGLQLNFIAPSINATLSGKTDYNAGDSATFVAGSTGSATGVTVTWIVPPAPSSEYSCTPSGNQLSCTFNKPAEFALGIEFKGDCGAYERIDRDISIWPADIPVFSLQRPNWGRVNVPLTFKIPDATSGIGYTLYFGDGISTTVSAPLYETTHSYTLTGDYALKVNATKASTTVEKTFGTISIVPQPVPVVNFSVSPGLSGAVPFTTTVDATASYGVNNDGTPRAPNDNISCSVDFGNGDVFGACITSSTYSTAGSYVLKVYVTDLLNGQVNSSQVNINPY